MSSNLPGSSKVVESLADALYPDVPFTPNAKQIFTSPPTANRTKTQAETSYPSNSFMTFFSRLFFPSVSKSEVQPFSSCCPQTAAISSSLISDRRWHRRQISWCRFVSVWPNYCTLWMYAYFVKTLPHVCCERTFKGDFYIFILALD